MVFTMINRKSLKLGVALLLLPLLLVGCFEEELITYDGPSVVEWEPPDRADNLLELTAALDPDQQEPEDITLGVQLIGPQENTDRTINVGVSEDASEAQEGVHFEILNDGNTAVIPANDSFGDVDIRIHADQLENGETLEAILVLEESDDLGVAENMREFELTIEKEEPEDAE